MNKKYMTKGFTLAELLIVVAIIGVLVAISIPIFGSRLEGSRESTDVANLRSAYAAATAVALTGKDNAGNTVKLTDGPDYFLYTKDGELVYKGTDKGTDFSSNTGGMLGKSTQKDWQGTDLSVDLPGNIIFNGNSEKGAIYVAISENGNKVYVAFVTKDGSFPDTGATTSSTTPSASTDNAGT